MAEQRKCHSTPHKIPIFFIHAPNIETSHVLVFTFNAIPVHIFIPEMSESLFFISAGVEAEQAWLHVNAGNLFLFNACFAERSQLVFQ